MADPMHELEPVDVDPALIPAEWVELDSGMLTGPQQIRSEALRAAGGLYLAHADDPCGVAAVADAVLTQARRFAHYIETGE